MVFPVRVKVSGRAARLAVAFGAIERVFKGGKRPRVFIHFAGKFLLKLRISGLQLSDALVGSAEIGLNLLDDGGHRLMHVSETGVIAGLLTSCT